MDLADDLQNCEITLRATGRLNQVNNEDKLGSIQERCRGYIRGRWQSKLQDIQEECREPNIEDVRRLVRKVTVEKNYPVFGCTKRKGKNTSKVFYCLECCAQWYSNLLRPSKRRPGLEDGLNNLYRLRTVHALPAHTFFENMMKHVNGLYIMNRAIFRDRNRKISRAFGQRLLPGLPALHTLVAHSQPHPLFGHAKLPYQASLNFT